MLTNTTTTTTTTTTSKTFRLTAFTALSLAAAALGQAHAQSAVPAGFSLCSAENQRCNFTGTQTVAFGAQGKYVNASKTGGTDCNVPAFGTDPLSGVAKSCYIVQPAPQQPAPQQPAAQPPVVQPPAVQPAQPQQPTSAPLSRERLQNATYVIMPPVVQGNTNLVNADQLKEIIAAMSRDSASALKRHYPGAQFGQDANAQNVVRVTPLLVAPGSLTPWATLQGQLILQDSTTGQQLISKGSYGLLTVYNHRADAANFVFDQLTQQLP